MKISGVYKLIFLIIISSASCSSGSQNINNTKDDNKIAPEKNIVPGEYLAVIKVKTDIEDIRKKFDVYGIKEFKFVTSNILKISLKTDPGLEKVKKLASSLKQIKSIEPNRIIRLDDPVRAKQIQIK